MNLNNKTIVLVDGENLLLRYQEMLATGRKPKDDVVHKKDKIIWHTSPFEYFYGILRISYYTTIVGDNDSLAKLSKEISALRYYCQSDSETECNGTLNPHVFKKEKQSSKNKSVDINITIDALRHAYNRDVEMVYLMSGDGDYIPLIKEIMHHGVQVSVGAFSSGCNKELCYIADDFFDLDKVFFND